MSVDQSGLPFSMPVAVRKLSKKGSLLKYEAPDDMRPQIAEAYDLLAVETFHANALVSPWKKNGVKIVGRVTAELIQPCAITAEPLATNVEEEIDVLFVPEGSKLALPKLDGEGEIIVDPDGPDLPETFTGDTIDLGAVWLEFFALGLDPFAQKIGAKLPEELAASDEAEEKDSPFAALAALKKH